MTHDTGTTSAGVRTTAVSNAETRLIVDVVDKIFLLEANKHPLVTLLTNVGRTWDGSSWKGTGMLKAATGNYEFGWFI